MKNISFIGSGNVATQLAIAFFEKGFNITQIISKHLENAEVLAEKVNAEALDSVQKLKEADICLICVSDDIIAEISPSLPQHSKTLFVHTSGSIEMDVLNITRRGVFYPLQTFSKQGKFNFSGVPILLEANNKEDLASLHTLASHLSENVSELNSEKRKALHLAAVIANNFTNYLFHQIQDYCQDQGLDFNLLKPLIEKTAQANLPQTGPAKRGDINVIKEHLAMLDKNPQLKDLYIRLSKSILETYGHSTEL